MGFSGGYLRISGPESMGGKGDCLRALTDADLSDPESIKQEINGDVVRVTGMPPMYDWEFYPQALEAKKGRIVTIEAMMSKYANVTFIFLFHGSLGVTQLYRSCRWACDLLCCRMRRRGLSVRYLDLDKQN